MFTSILITVMIVNCQLSYEKEDDVNINLLIVLSTEIDPML